MSPDATALKVAPATTLVRPRLSVPQLVDALTDYRALQHALDTHMPEQIMMLDGKPFRKKGYWRAIGLAFELSVEPITAESAERSVVSTLEDGSDNYVYTVTYRAMSPNGRSACGDGSCAASEKEKGRMHASEHNVRSHAHTRAWNRAVSNLVGFGEVSAEEVERPGGVVIEGKVATPAHQAGDPVFVVAIEHKSGVKKQDGKPDKPWHSYTVSLSDGRHGSTFDGVLALDAERLKDTKTPVTATFETKGQYTNLTALDPATTPATPTSTASAPMSSTPEQKAVYTVTRVVQMTGGGFGIETAELGAGQFVQTSDPDLAKAALKSKIDDDRVEMVFSKKTVTANGVEIVQRSLVELTLVRRAYRGEAPQTMGPRDLLELP